MTLAADSSLATTASADSSDSWLVTLCKEAKLSEASAALLLAAEIDLSEWLALLGDARPAFLKQLQQLGVAKLSERQGIANVLAKLKREARLPEASAQQAAVTQERLARERLAKLWARPEPPPPIAEMERDAAERLRSIPAYADSSALDDTALIRSIPADERLAALIDAGVPEAHAALLLDALPVRGLRVGFYSNQLCERGTETALFDYADYAERLLGVQSYILYDASSPKNVKSAIYKFSERFGERLLAIGRPRKPDDDWRNDNFAPREIAPALLRHQITHCYIIKFGHPDEPSIRYFQQPKQVVAPVVAAVDVTNNSAGPPPPPPPASPPFRTRVLVHAVFDGRTPHGDVYARISPCVPAKSSVPVVPHINRRKDPEGPDLREELNIPSDATVFGRHGGYDVFDIMEARAAVLSVAKQRPDSIYFVLLNTRPLILDENGEALWHEIPKNIKHLPATLDDDRKAAFIRTCDRMLHARHSGRPSAWPLLNSRRTTVRCSPRPSTTTMDGRAFISIHSDRRASSITTRAASRSSC